VWEPQLDDWYEVERGGMDNKIAVEMLGVVLRNTKTGCLTCKVNDSQAGARGPGTSYQARLARLGRRPPSQASISSLTGQHNVFV
jgi:hypothetical protein